MFGMLRAILASPHPKSATIRALDLDLIFLMIMLRLRDQHDVMLNTILCSHILDGIDRPAPHLTLKPDMINFEQFGVLGKQVESMVPSCRIELCTDVITLHHA